MSVITNNLLLTDDGYNISRSVRLRSSASAYFNRTQSTPTDEKKFTQSVWVKRGKLGVYQAVIGGRDNATGQTPLYFTSGDQIGWGESDGVSTYYSGTTAAVFRDPSAWYHIVTVYDSNNATAADRLIIYVNGVRQTITVSGSGSSIPSGRAGYWNQSGTSVLLGAANTGTDFFDGLITEIYNIDGQALTPSSFGETDSITGVWKPKKYAGTYGTNGFFLNFSDNSSNTATTIGKDYSGNGNNWTPNNISVTSGVTYDSMLDVPTMWADGGNGRGNYCVLNPLNNVGGSSIVNGNLDVTTANTGAGRVVGTIAVSSDKWYWEITPTNLGANASIGIAPSSETTAVSIGSTSTTYGYLETGNKYNNNSASSYGASYTVNDVIGVALDLSAGTLVFYKNGTSQGTAFSSLSGIFVPAISDGGTPTSTFVSNFGQRPFAYTPPTGFKALNTQNLPAGSITTSGSFTGNASSDGPFVYLNGVPTAMTINGNAVTFATHVDKTANGFKVRSSSSSYNASGSNTYSITTTGAKFKYANAQVNP